MRRGGSQYALRKPSRRLMSKHVFDISLFNALHLGDEFVKIVRLCLCVTFFSVTFFSVTFFVCNVFFCIVFWLPTLIFIDFRPIRDLVSESFLDTLWRPFTSARSWCDTCEKKLIVHDLPPRMRCLPYRRICENCQDFYLNWLSKSCKKTNSEEEILSDTMTSRHVYWYLRAYAFHCQVYESNLIPKLFENHVRVLPKSTKNL